MAAEVYGMKEVLAGKAALSLASAGSQYTSTPNAPADATVWTCTS